MVAIKSKAHIRQLAEQRLPVPSADVLRLVSENERLREALEGMLKLGMTYQQQLDAIYTARAALSNTQES